MFSMLMTENLDGYTLYYRMEGVLPNMGIVSSKSVMR